MQEEMSEGAVEHLVAETEERVSEGEAHAASGARVDALERRVRELEAAIGDLRSMSAAGAVEARGRKTAVSGSRLLAKGGEPVGGASVDAALLGLSPEQRMSVKSGLLRAGLL